MLIAFINEIIWASSFLCAEKAMAAHSSTLVWKIPWTEEPGRLQSMGPLRVGYDWAIPFHFSISCIGEGNGNPLQCSCLENPRDGGAWWAAVYGVAQSRTRLKRLSSSSSSSSSFLCEMRFNYEFNFFYIYGAIQTSCSFFISFFKLYFWMNLVFSSVCHMFWHKNVP